MSIPKSQIPETLLQQLRNNVALSSPAHLKQWLRESGREWIVFNAADLVDALPWPDGVDTMIALVEGYRQHRMTITVEEAPCPKLRLHAPGRVCELCRNAGTVPVKVKTDALEPDEIDAGIAYLSSLKG